MSISLKKIRMINLLIIEILIGVAVNLALLWIFFEVSEHALSRQVGMFDYLATYVIQSFRSPFMTEVMKLITIFGGPGILAGSLAVAFLLSVHRHNRRSVQFLMLIVSGVLLNLILKVAFHRPRPEGPLIDEYFYSFPSGHAMNAFIFYMSIAYMFYHYTRDRVLGIIMAVAMALWVFIIGVSRVYLGVHYPSDVVAGFLAGMWWLVTMLIFEKILSVEHLLQKPKKSA